MAWGLLGTKLLSDPMLMDFSQTLRNKFQWKWINIQYRFVCSIFEKVWRRDNKFCCVFLNILNHSTPLEMFWHHICNDWSNGDWYYVTWIKKKNFNDEIVDSWWIHLTWGQYCRKHPIVWRRREAYVSTAGHWRGILFCLDVNWNVLHGWYILTYSLGC